MESWMSDPDAAWWAKLRRANTHLETLAKLVDEFAASEPYTLDREPGDRPNELAYRLHIRHETPAEISTVIGDVLHNLRSALDSVAYELAVRSKGEPLTGREEQVTAFPWRPSSSEYDRFFGIGVDAKNPDAAHLVLRGRIYSQEAKNAMRVVQPFSWLETATLPPTERSRIAHAHFKWSAIHRLNQLSNIDKHRRLSTVGLRVPLLWWRSGERDDTHLRPGHMPPTHNEILCYLVGPNAANIDLNPEFALVLTDDPTHQPATDTHYRPEDCQRLLRDFARDIAAKVEHVLSQYAKS
jgi:hypothetical protein